MCSIVEQENLEGEDVARFVQGSLLNKVGMMTMDNCLIRKELQKLINSGL